MLTKPIAVASDVDDVTVMHEAIDEGRGHDIIAEDLAPLLEAFVAREDRGRVFVPPRHELEEEHGGGPEA